MAIKDQCYGCKYYDGNSLCSQNILLEHFDGSPCEKYEKKGIDISKGKASSVIESLTTPPVSITPEYLKSVTNIHGWLSFFFFAILVGSILSFVVGISNIDLISYSNSIWLVLSDISLWILLLVIAGTTVYAFVKRRPDAVYLGLLYVALIFVSNLIVLITGDFEENSYFGSSRQTIRSVIWGIIWSCYLLFSPQVKETIPKSYRKCTRLFFILLISVILVPMFGIAVGVGDIRNNYEQQETIILQRELKEGEYTDGRIIFEKPSGYTCEFQDVDISGFTMRVFLLEDAFNNSLTICSDYTNEFSRTSFEDYWNSWQDEDVKFWGKTIIENNYWKLTKNDNHYYLKITKYEQGETVIYWMFALIYDKESGKEAVVSYYSMSNDSKPIKKLLNTIQFN